MANWAHLNIFPEPMILLNEETKHHPELQEKLACHPMNEWEMKLAEIALHCGVVLDGLYTPTDLENLCGILLNRLRNMRQRNQSIVIIS